MGKRGKWGDPQKEDPGFSSFRKTPSSLSSGLKEEKSSAPALEYALAEERSETGKGGDLFYVKIWEEFSS